MAAQLKLVVDFYRCEPCSRKQGVEVTELVRMMSKAAIFNGKLIGTEYWCCPICFDKKFKVKAVTGDARTEKVSKVPRKGGAERRRSKISKAAAPRALKSI